MPSKEEILDLCKDHNITAYQLLKHKHGIRVALLAGYFMFYGMFCLVCLTLLGVCSFIQYCCS